MTETPRTARALAMTLDDGHDLGPQHKRLTDACRELEAENNRMRLLLGEARNYLEGLELADRIDAQLGPSETEKTKR